MTDGRYGNWLVSPVYTVHASQVCHASSGILTDLHQGLDGLLWAVFTQEVQQWTTYRQTTEKLRGQQWKTTKVTTL